MASTMQELIIGFQNEAVAYGAKARKGHGSDRKKYRALESLTKDHAAIVQEGFMLAFTRPLMELVTPEFARLLVGTAKETNQGVGQAFKESANTYIEKAAAMETEFLGGVVFTKALLKYLNLVNWAYLGQYVEMLAGDIDIDMPVPKSCGREDCKIVEERVPTGWIVRCETCKRVSDVMATRPQAVVAWNRLDFDEGVHIAREPAHVYDVEKCVASIIASGYGISEIIFTSWTLDQQGKALNYCASGGKLPEPEFMKEYKSGLVK